MTSKTKSKTAPPKSKPAADRRTPVRKRVPRGKGAARKQAPAAADAPRRGKRADTAGKRPRPAVGGTPTLQEIGDGFLAHLTSAGKTVSTVASYAADLRMAYRFFGPDTEAGSLTPDEVAAFNASDPVTKTRRGKPKAKPGVEKTRRVLRLALLWAADQGLIESAPIPAQAPSN